MQTYHKQEEFIIHLKRDIDEMIKTKKELEMDVTTILSAQKNAYDATISKCEESIQKTQKMWKQDEKETLETMMLNKAKELRRDAVKALEPELLALMSKQKSKLSSLREDMEKEIKIFRMETKKKCKHHIDTETKRMEVEQSKNEEDVRKAHSIELSHIANQHMDEIHCIRSESRENMVQEQKRFDVQKKNQNLEYIKEIDDLNENSNLVYEHLLDAHRCELQEIQDEKQSELQGNKVEYMK